MVRAKEMMYWICNENMHCADNKAPSQSARLCVCVREGEEEESLCMRVCSFFYDVLEDANEHMFCSGEQMVQTKKKRDEHICKNAPPGFRVCCLYMFL